MVTESEGVVLITRSNHLSSRTRCTRQIRLFLGISIDLHIHWMKWSPEFWMLLGYKLGVLDCACFFLVQHHNEIDFYNQKISHRYG